MQKSCSSSAIEFCRLCATLYLHILDSLLVLTHQQFDDRTLHKHLI